MFNLGVNGSLTRYKLTSGVRKYMYRSMYSNNSMKDQELRHSFDRHISWRLNSVQVYVQIIS